jgi:hypothetical protein
MFSLHICVSVHMLSADAQRLGHLLCAHRCLVRESDQSAPSFLFESVVNGDQQGR